MWNFLRLVCMNLLLLTLVLLTSAGEASTRFQHLIPLEEKLMIFSEGLAPVKVGWKYGYIDVSGRLVIELDYDGALPFSEGLAPVRKGSLFGYIDKQARWVISPQFAEAGSFSSGLAPVKWKEKYGYIDLTGRTVIAPVFDSAQAFSEGLAVVSLGGRSGYIDQTGKFIIQPQFLQAESFREGLAAASLSSGYGYLAKDGTWAIRPQFEAVGQFGEGLAPIRTEGKYGYIDILGKMIFSPQFEAADSFRDKLAGVKIAGKAGYINKSGQVIVPSIYDAIGSFSDGLAAVRMNRKSFYINKTGEVTISNISIDTTPRDLKPEQWPGQKFIILPLDANYQSHGYSFRLQAPDPAMQVPGGTNLKSEALRGREVVVVTVQRSGQEYEVAMRECDSGILLFATTESQQIKHLALSEDVRKARRYFLGATIYTKNQYYGFVETGKPRKMNAIYFDDPLEVVDVWPGVHANQPVWLIADTKTGDRVYIPIAYSKTNLESSQMQKGLQWESVLFEQNPRVLYTWSDSVWSKIKSGIISPGMQMDQVRLAWGSPVSILTEKQGGNSIVVWIYPTTQLYFSNAVLLSIKDR